MRRLVSLLIGCLVLIPVVSAQLTTSLPEVIPANVTGDIVVDGTDSLRILTQNLARRFTLDGYLDEILISTNGTSTGIQRFCNGEVDIVMADRQMTPQEQNTCNSNGRNPVPFRVATASVSVVVSESNTFLNNATTTDLQGMFANVLQWDGIQAAYPAQPIARFGPPSTSPVYFNFALSVYGGDARPLATAINSQYLADLDAAIEQIAANQFAVGFYESRFVTNEAQGVRAITINGVEPTFTTIVAGNYPLSRPLIMYSSESVMRSKGQVASFINYYLTNVSQETTLAGVYPPSQQNLDVSGNTWRSVMGVASNAPTPVPPLAPAATEEAPANGATPEIATPEIVTPEPVEETVVEPEQPIVIFSGNAESILTALTNDIVVIATQISGIQRPEGFQDNLSLEDPQLPILLRLNVEILAGVQYGADARPDNWFGAVPSSQLSIIRDVRHDIEVLANDVYGESRPATWIGDNPVYSCDRTTQALIGLLETTGAFALSVPANASDFCQQAAQEAALFTELNLLAQPTTAGALGQGGGAAVTIDTNFAVSFFTSNASTRAGVVPNGETVVPLARSNSGFSNMTLVQGNGFLLFIDYNDSTLTTDQFEDLQTLEDYGDFESVCNADWCE